MSEALFNIVFKGKFDGKIEKDTAILHFSKLFNLSTEQATIFFDGNQRILKKAVTLDKAGTFRAALKKAGLRVALDKITTKEDDSGFTISEVGAIIVDKPFIQPQHFDTSQFEVDELGVEIVEPEFIEKLEFDLHEYQIDEVGVQIIDQPEVPTADIDTTALSIDEVGAVFAQKQQIAAPELDISNISMQEVGATIVEKKNIVKADINTDNIKIID
ncbi:MAG: hypothetical protein L3J53_00500 [Proteobacteria bacterium]|nr:hypothetical protein [Pseudomonadota bacterium]